MKRIAAIIFFIAILALVFFQWMPDSRHEEKAVIALGDSLTYGYGDKKGEEGYIDELERKGNKQKEGGTGIHILNYGVSGQETEGVLKQLNEPDILSRFANADEFIVFIGTNDFINSNGGDLTEINDRKIVREKPRFLRNLTEIIQTIEKENSHAEISVIGLYNPYQGREEVERHIESWNKSIRNLASEDKRIHYIHTNDVFKGLPKKEVFADDLHPNDKGYRMLSERVSESIMEE